MDVALIVASITAAVSIAGWAVNHILTTRRETRNSQRAAYLKYVERQLEELYGPLAILVAEGSQAFRDLLGSLGRNYVFRGDAPLPPDEWKTWMFWVENEFLPRSAKIKDLLMTKAHLVEGNMVPTSYLRFLDHYNSWSINHSRWQREGVEYSWRSRINYPGEFSTEIMATLQSLKSRHAELVAAVGREGEQRRSTRLVPLD
jgi:hypothetical protein